MNKVYIFFGILVTLSASRFLPHPPNFTSLIALSFYIPLLLGRKYILSFVFTDLIIGFHKTTFFTWGSVFLIGYFSKYFFKNILHRIAGALSGSLLFFIITNFGVWLTGMYEYNLVGFLNCYYLAIPFFTYSLISTLVFSFIIEVIYKIFKTKILKKGLIS